jgi:hypothetical protein
MKTPISLLLALIPFALSACREENSDDPSKPLPPIVIKPITPGDLRALITEQLASGNKQIVIPPGRYPVESTHEGHLLFSNLKDIEIIAENVELICTSTNRAVLFDNCTNVTLRGLTIDYDPLPFTQGKISTMAPDKRWIEFEVADGYPDSNLKGPFQIYNPATATLRRGDTRWSDEIEPLGNRRYRITKAPRYRFDPAVDTQEIGDILIAKSANGASGSPHAVELRTCRSVRLEDITLFASPSFGFLERGCHGTTYLRCVVGRRTPENDPIPRAIPRMRSLNADAFHSKDAPKGPAILSCTARFMGDDAVNINGRFHFVRGSTGNQVRIAVIDRHATIRHGDAVQFLPFSGPRQPDAKVIRRVPDPEPFTAQQKSIIRTLSLDADMRASLLEGKAQYFILTLDREISLPLGTLIACSDRLGHGFSVKDCDFGENRSRGILIKASNGEISGNRITNSRMHAILVSPEFWWMEAGMSSNLIIQNNHIKDCLETPIEIHALGGNRQILPAGALHNISILNNRIEDSVWPLIHVTSTSDLTMDRNILPKTPTVHVYGNKGKPSQSILLENCYFKKPGR